MIVSYKGSDVSENRETIAALNGRFGLESHPRIASAHTEDDVSVEEYAGHQDLGNVAASYAEGDIYKYTYMYT